MKYEGSRILVVDDERSSLQLLGIVLEEAGYRDIAMTPDPFEAIKLYENHRPDIVLVDLHMPGLNGYTLIGELRSKRGGGAVPIVVLTSDDSKEARERALRAGASDFLAKPFDTVEVVLRIRNLLKLRHMHVDLESRNRTLDQAVRERTAELDAARLETLDRLAIAAEYRDDATGRHARRVGELAAAIAERMLPAEADAIARAAPLHDLGKIGVPDWILLKPGSLTPGEFRIMQTHTTIGAQILGGSRSKILQMAERIALTHHERWDGRGYSGLRGEEIPVEGRIVAIADAFDAMTHDRPYRSARPLDVATEEIVGEAGRQFDRELVEAFLEVRDQVFATSPSL